MTKSGSHRGNSLRTGSCGANRAGFTILELFVSVAVIGMLMALVLPAVQQTREAARLAQCRNNLRQIGEALHNFEAAEGTLPAGCEFQNSNLHSRRTRILPFIDEAPLYDQYNFSAAWNDPPSNLQILSGSASPYWRHSNSARLAPR